MIRAINCLIALCLVLPTHEQSTPPSPCPNVFSYEPPGSEPGRWYGEVNLSTDSTLHSVWLNVVLDSKADILGNWIGDVTTQDNIDFRIENTKMKLDPGPAVAVRFFVQYNSLKPAPRLQEIRLNGREICNAKTRPVVSPPQDRPGVTTGVVRPAPIPTVTTNTNSDSGRPRPLPEDALSTKPIRPRPGTGTLEPIFPGPVYPKPNNSPNPSSILGGGENQVATPSPPRPRPEYFDHSNSGSTSNKDSEDYWQGGPNIITIPKPENQNQCGTVILNSAIPLVVNGTPTLEGQWPWQVALYQAQTVDNKYTCGGTLVSHRHVITAAHCVTRKGSRNVVNRNILQVYLGKHNLRFSVTGVQIRFVGEISVHPDYNPSTFNLDIAILTLAEPVTYTKWVRPCCLWPETQIDLRNIINKKGSVVGWGYDETGVASEELSLVEMPVVNQETCIRSYSEFFAKYTSEQTFCAGYRDGTSVCNGDSGGGLVFRLGDRWHLRGVVSLSVARENEQRCDPSHYVIFADVAKTLKWVDQIVYDI